MNKKNNYLNNLRHSCAHLLAAAVKDLHPGVHNAIGPSIENGFYQDFDMVKWTVSEADFPKIEKRMRELLKSWAPFEEKEVSVKQALKDFAKNPYKVELIKDFAKADKKITENNPGNFLDLCKGGHSHDPKKELKNFKLLSIAGAYWRGDEKKKMLTRIYGTLFPTKEELDKYLWQQEEAKKRDHRKLGRDLGLFLISDQVGPGLPIFLPKGAVVRSLIEEYLIKLKKDNGYKFVWTPHIARSQIYHTSQHWGKYDAMFSAMKLDKEEYVLKPMNCPHHFQVFLDKPRSYKELPFRIAENGVVYRHEKSGEVSGLLRVRALTIDDTHTFIRFSQTYEELNRVLKLIKDVFDKFGFKEFKARISLRDSRHPEKYLGSPEEWERAENALKNAAKHLQIKYNEGVGEAAFYGPKIDIMVKDNLGREWQLSTVQLDYNQPKNFSMKYIDEKGKDVYPAILHIAMVGSIERFMAILIEHYAGAFPLWLSPIQVAILPISDKHISYSKKIKELLEKDDIRVELNDENKTIGAKIREATLQKIPYMVIIGAEEIRRSTILSPDSIGKGSHYQQDKLYISVRTREGKNLGLMNLYEFIKKLKSQIETFL